MTLHRDAEARQDGDGHRRRSRSARTRRRSASSTRRARSTIPADRDHCIQYMVAVPLIFGRLTAARLRGRRRRRPAHRRAARARSTCVEDPQFTRDYHDPDEALDRQRADRRIQRRHASSTEVVVEYPIGHSAAARKACRCWWRSSAPTSRAASPRSSSRRSSTSRSTQTALEAMPVHEFVDLMVHLNAHPFERRRHEVRRACDRCCSPLAARGAAAAQDFPKLRAGLWQTSTTHARRQAPPTSRRAHVTTICIDDDACRR